MSCSSSGFVACLWYNQYVVLGALVSFFAVSAAFLQSLRLGALVRRDADELLGPALFAGGDAGPRDGAREGFRHAREW